MLDQTPSSLASSDQLSLNVSDKMSSDEFIVAPAHAMGNDLHHSYAEVVAYGAQRQQQRARHLLIFCHRVRFKIECHLSSL